jgi:NitT/TauT family transport system permease protein
MPPLVRTPLEAIVGLVIVLLIWAGAAFIVASPLKLPAPDVVIAKAYEVALSEDYLRHLTESLTILLFGLVPALAAGVLIGATVARGARLIVGPLIVVLAAAPMAALLPLAVLWWGITVTAKAVFVFMMTAFAVMNTIMIAARPARPRSASESTGGAMPRRGRGIACAVFGGLRLGVLLGVTALIFSEFTASSRGIGFFIFSAANMFDTTAMLAGAVLVIVPTVLVVALLQAIEEQLAR